MSIRIIHNTIRFDNLFKKEVVLCWNKKNQEIENNFLI